MEKSANIHDRVRSMMLTTKRSAIGSIQGVMRNEMLDDKQKLELIDHYLEIHRLMNEAEHTYLDKCLR